MKKQDLLALLEYLNNVNFRFETFRLDAPEKIPAYTGVYFVSSSPHLLYIGCSNKIQNRIASHTRLREFHRYGKRGDELTVSCVRVDDLERTRLLEMVCIKQFNPLLNVASKRTYNAVMGFEELLQFATNFYYQSGQALFNGANKFYPYTVNKDSFIHAVQYAIAPSADIKMLAHIPCWEDPDKYKPAHYDGGDITGCRPMIDAELKHLYKLRGYDQERLQKILESRRRERAEYIQTIVNNIKAISDLVYLEIDSFSKFLSVYCPKRPDLKKFYSDLLTPQKVELLHQILETVDYAPMIEAVTREFRQYY